LIILDTNVVSALMSGKEPRVQAWVDLQSGPGLFITAVSLYELRYGVLRLPQGRRRDELEARLRIVSDRTLAGRVLPFDADAAEAMARLQADRESRGRVVEQADAQIAGIAIARRAAVCTRNVRHFEDAGVPVVNPWG
jgi:predicted nucleic acid-binding protein